MVKTYVGARVQLIFDTPQNSFLVTALKEQCAEFEWRLNFQQEMFSVVEN